MLVYTCKHTRIDPHFQKKKNLLVALCFNSKHLCNSTGLYLLILIHDETLSIYLIAVEIQAIRFAFLLLLFVILAHRAHINVYHITQQTNVTEFGYMAEVTLAANQLFSGKANIMV